jgi:IMP dehydrogenase/GMP reductase
MSGLGLPFGKGTTLPNDFSDKLQHATAVHTFRDFILLPGRSEVEPKEIDLATKLSTNIALPIPVVSSPMDSVTGWRLALAMARAGGAGVIHRNLSTDDQVEQVRRVKKSKGDVRSADGKGNPLVGAAVSPMDKERCTKLDRVADFLVCDVAHFHNSNVMKAAARTLPGLSKDFIVGNIGTRKAARDVLAELPRVDGFRVGIGSGSVCITTQLTRVGAPTLFAVAEVCTALAEENSNVPVIADGGIRSPGDATLALATGASSVMIGSVLAGSDESPGGFSRVDGRKVKVHRGMASAAARRTRFALDRYAVPSKGLEEGVEAYVSATGAAGDTLTRFSDGLKAAFGYAGAKGIHDLWTVASFGAVSGLGFDELGVHSLAKKVKG